MLAEGQGKVDNPCLAGWTPPPPPPVPPEEERQAFGTALREALLRRWPDTDEAEATERLSIMAMYPILYLRGLMDGPWPAAGMHAAVRRDLERALGCRLPAITGALDAAAAGRARAAKRAEGVTQA